MIQLLFNSTQWINQKYKADCLRCANLPHSPLHVEPFLCRPTTFVPIILSVIPMLIKLELKTTLVLGLYKLSALAIVRLLSSSQILSPPPPDLRMPSYYKRKSRLFN